MQRLPVQPDAPGASGVNDGEMSHAGAPPTDAVLDRGWVPDRDGGRRQIIGAVTKLEARILGDLVREYGCERTLETGVALGVSTLALTHAVSARGGTHYGIDPFQMSEHRGAALELLDEHGLRQHFELREGPSHLELPRLLEEGHRFDLVFIDGWHTFDNKLLDYFYADRMLSVGGWLVVHDLWFDSVRKLLGFVRGQGTYEIDSTRGGPWGWSKKLKARVSARLGEPPPLDSPNLLVMRKSRDDLPPWDHYVDF